MAKLVLQTLSWPDEDIRLFLPEYQAFMGKTIINPTFLGVTKITYSLVVACFPGGSPKGGFNLVVETNRQMNNNSRNHIRSLTRGFLGGWMTRHNKIKGATKLSLEDS